MPRPRGCVGDLELKQLIEGSRITFSKLEDFGITKEQPPEDFRGVRREHRNPNCSQLLLMDDALVPVRLDQIFARLLRIFSHAFPL